MQDAKPPWRQFAVLLIVYPRRSWSAHSASLKPQPLTAGSLGLISQSNGEDTADRHSFHALTNRTLAPLLYIAHGPKPRPRLARTRGEGALRKDPASMAATGCAPPDTQLSRPRRRARSSPARQAPRRLPRPAACGSAASASWRHGSARAAGRAARRSQGAQRAQPLVQAGGGGQELLAAAGEHLRGPGIPADAALARHSPTCSGCHTVLGGQRGCQGDLCKAGCMLSSGSVRRSRQQRRGLLQGGASFFPPYLLPGGGCAPAQGTCAWCRVVAASWPPFAVPHPTVRIRVPGGGAGGAAPGAA